MKKVTPDPPIETILPLKGAHKQVALEWIIKLIEQHDDKPTVEQMIDMNLSIPEYRKVMKEVNKVILQLQKKVDKIKGPWK